MCIYITGGVARIRWLCNAVMLIPESVSLCITGPPRLQLSSYGARACFVRRLAERGLLLSPKQTTETQTKVIRTVLSISSHPSVSCYFIASERVCLPSAGKSMGEQSEDCLKCR